MMRRALLDVRVGAGEVSGCPGLPLEAQDGGVGRCGTVWLGVLHLRTVWFLPPGAEREGADPQTTEAPHWKDNEGEKLLLPKACSSVHSAQFDIKNKKNRLMLLFCRSIAHCNE